MACCVEVSIDGSASQRRTLTMYLQRTRALTLTKKDTGCFRSYFAGVLERVSL